MMRLPISPTFIRFFDVLDERTQDLTIEKFKHFFREAVEGVSTIDCSVGYITHSSLGQVKLYVLTLTKFHGECEVWHVIFFDTSIPHAVVEMVECVPTLQNAHSIEMDYTTPLIQNSLAHIASGFVSEKKMSARNLLYLFKPSFAISGTVIWIYLKLKLDSQEVLKRCFLEKNNAINMPYYLFGELVYNRLEPNKRNEIVTVLDEKKEIGNFLRRQDSLLLDILGRDWLSIHLNQIGLNLESWLS